MTKSDAAIDVRQSVCEIFIQVFETMLSMKAEIAADRTMPQGSDRVTGSVGFCGEKVIGAAYIHLSRNTAAQAASAMLGTPAEDLGEPDINDAIGELSNMITGGFKSSLCNAGLACGISTPAIIRGKFEIEPMPDIQREVILFDYQSERMAVEIHIKFN